MEGFGFFEVIDISSLIHRVGLVILSFCLSALELLKRVKCS